MTMKRFNITSFSGRLLGPEDKRVFNRFFRLLRDDLDCPDGPDAIQLLHMELAALYLVRLLAAENAGNVVVAECFNRMVCLHLKALKPARRKPGKVAVGCRSEKTRK